MKAQNNPDLRWLLVVLLAAVTSILYWPVSEFHFLNHDDDRYVSHNPNVQKGLTGKTLGWAFTSIVCANWHPLTMLSHATDWEVFGGKAGGHHLMNLLIHTGTVILMFLAFQRMAQSWHFTFIVALLFAIHPMNIQSVAWIAERKNVLSTFFWFLTIWYYLRFVAKPGAGNYVVLCLAFLLGLLSKPMLVTLPCVLLLLDLWPLKRASLGDVSAWGRLVKEKLPLLVLSAVFSIITLLTQDKSGTVSSFEHISAGVRLSNAIVSYVAYLGKCFWPVNLAIFYPHPGSHPPLEKLLLSGAVFIGLTIWSIRQIRQKPYLCVGWFWYVGTLVPVIGLVQVGNQAMADRYAYVPFIGIFMMMAMMVEELIRKGGVVRKVVLATLFGVMILLSLQTRAELKYWNDSESIMSRAIQVTRQNYLAHYNLGVAHIEKGRLNEAIREFETAIRFEPNYTAALYNLGTAHMEKSDWETASNYFARLLSIQPNHSLGLNNLATILIRRQHYEKAIEHLQHLLNIDPNYAPAHNNIGIAYLNISKPEQAIIHFKRALEISPDYKKAQENLETAKRMIGQK